jgi:GGDEF domain-containing protein
MDDTQERRRGACARLPGLRSGRPRGKEGEMVTEEEWSGEVARSARFRLISPVIALGAFAAIFIPCMMLGQSLASGIYADLVSVGIIMGFMLPLAFTLVVFGERQQRRTDEKVRGLNAELSCAVADAERLNVELSAAMAEADHQAEVRDSQVQRQRFESRLANALDIAEGEPEVIEVIERSFSSVLPEAAVELLLADNSHAHLHRMAAVGPDGKPPSCGVDSPDRCPAARRAQIQEFTDSEHLDACPKLRNRPEGRLSALCVPVSIMGRTVGVIHATGDPGEKMDDDDVDDLATLAKLAGARIGLLRVMAETQLQASTDTLTGLLNRRSFSQRVSAVPSHLYPIAVAMADLDHFKALNDTFGHETGDRALRLFARVLRDSLRASDLVSRHGGEEFAIAFPDCSAVDAIRALNTVRA